MTTFQKFSNVDYPCVKSRCYEDLRPKKKWKFSFIIASFRFHSCPLADAIRVHSRAFADTFADRLLRFWGLEKLIMFVIDNAFP